MASFCGLPFGASREDVEKLAAFTSYVDNPGSLLTSASAELEYAGFPFRASLNFEREHGLQAVHGGFASARYPDFKARFLEDFGDPDDSGLVFYDVIILPGGRQLVSGTPPAIESLLWYKERLFVSLQDRTNAGPFGQLRVATYRYMKRNSVWLMNQGARRALVSAGELVMPPPDWPEEPQSFEGLRIGAPIEEVAGVLQVAPPAAESIHSGWHVPLCVASLPIAGRLDFHCGRLLQVSGEFDVSDWGTLKSLFLQRYGPPRHIRNRTLSDVLCLEEWHWSSEWLTIGLSACPGGSDPGRFYLGPA